MITPKYRYYYRQWNGKEVECSSAHHLLLKIKFDNNPLQYELHPFGASDLREYFNSGKVSKSLSKYSYLLSKIRREKLKYLECDHCGARIYEGAQVYHVDGLVYTCCSASCLLDLITNYQCTTLNELTAHTNEWELNTD